MNNPGNAAPRGSVVQIFATGAGFIPGAPPDGVGATSPLPTPNTPDVIIGICRVDDTSCTHDVSGNVKYSGVSSWPGVWQINVRIPQSTAPSAQVPVVVLMNNYPSSDANSGFRTVIAVKE